MQIEQQHVRIVHLAGKVRPRPRWLCFTRRNPGRNDPGTGEMDYPNGHKAIQKTGFGI